MSSARGPSFRVKIFGIAGISMLAIVAMISSGSALARRVVAQQELIEESYIPKIDLEPRLEAQLERIARSFQDAVGTHDADELAATGAAKDRFLAELDAAGGAVDPKAAAELRAALEDYYAAAYDVSRRLIADETGEAVVGAVIAMQTKQARVEKLVKSTAALDRHALAEAFAASARAEATSRNYQLWIGLACLGAVVFLSIALSRSVLRAVATLTEGFERFGKGDFGRPIPITSRDEVGDLAAHANRMAENLEHARRERAKVETALKISNRELEAFSYSVAHDLRAPLRGINGFSHALLEDYGDTLDATGKAHLRRIATAAGRMGELIDALLAFSRLSRTELRHEQVDLSRIADSIVDQLRATQPDRSVDFAIEPGVIATGDPALLRAVLENLLGNAWKFTAEKKTAKIEFGAEKDGGPGRRAYFVRDDGAGFDVAYAGKLFAPFQRLHSTTQFAGTGVGLATVQRIVERHGGSIEGVGVVDKGATFKFTLPEKTEREPNA